MGIVINQLKNHSTQNTNWQAVHDTVHKEPNQMYIKEKHSSDVGCHTARPPEQLFSCRDIALRYQLAPDKEAFVTNPVTNPVTFLS